MNDKAFDWISSIISGNNHSNAGKQEEIEGKQLVIELVTASWRKRRHSAPWILNNALNCEFLSQQELVVKFKNNTKHVDGKLYVVRELTKRHAMPTKTERTGVVP